MNYSLTSLEKRSRSFVEKDSAAFGTLRKGVLLNFNCAVMSVVFHQFVVTKKTK